MKTYYSNYEKKYSIKEIFRVLLEKLWLIILVAVIFAAVLGITQISINDTSATAVLNDKEQKEVDKYISYVKSYEEEEERLENSYAYNLNAHDVITSYSQYFVKASNEKNSYDVLNALIEYLRSGGLARDTAKLTDIARQDEIFDLIVLDVNDNQQNKEQVTNVFGIKFYADDEAFCNQLNTAIKQAFETYANSLDEVIAENDLILLSNSNVKGYNQYYYNWQNSKKEQVERMKTETQALYDKLSFEQQTYINNILDDVDVDLDTDTEGGNVLKLVVIGGALGFLLSVAILILYYMFDSNIKTEDELQDNFDILYMGNLSILEKSKWSAVIRNIIAGKKADSRVELTKLCNHMISLCKKESINKLTILVEDEKILGNYFDSLQVQMKEKNISLVCINDIYKELVCCENVILVTVKNKSKCQDITDIVNVCTAGNIKILGYVMVV